MIAPGCLRCGKPIGLTSTGRLRKDKRFCSSKCQQENVRDARRDARAQVLRILNEPRFTLDPELFRLRELLHVLGAA